MCRLGKGTRQRPFPIMENGNGRITEPEDDQFTADIRKCSLIKKYNQQKIMAKARVKDTALFSQRPCH